MPPATIVSLTPFPVSANLASKMPTHVWMPAATKVDEATKKILPVTFVIEDPCFARYYVGEDYIGVQSNGVILMPVAPRSIADEVVTSNIYSAPLIEDTAKPAVFAVDGAYSVERVVKELQEEINERMDIQDEWFRKLVEMADDKWTRTHAYAAISNLEREAAKRLALKREWTERPDPSKLTECPYCMTLISKRVVKCPNCLEVVDVARYKILKALEEEEALEKGAAVKQGSGLPVIPPPKAQAS